MSAELIADGGAASAAPEFFRSPEFLRAEGATHTLLVERGPSRLALPLIVREIPGGEGLDAASPYGYPGGTLSGEAPQLTPTGLGESGLVAIFVRDRVGPPAIAGGSERGRVLLHDPARPRRLRETFASEIRRNERDGYRNEVIEGSAIDAEALTGFNQLYEQTMRRAGAAERYFFGADYLRGCLGFERSWLTLTRAPDGELGAGAIAAVSDSVLHYFLAGTADAHRGASPGKNTLLALIELADELELPLNLGGGIRPGDGLEAFKRGFANSEDAFRTHELVCDPDAYERLSAARPAATPHGPGGYFPAYRAPASG